MSRVLVVDDSQFVRMRTAKLLREHGHEVLEAGNGREAVELYGRERPDLVLLDITMPEMDGLTALREILAADAGARVVMCTALAQKATVLEAIKAGAKDFLVKPFEPERVLQSVERWGSPR
ncbi:MAG: response regulator [Firmicutes bacterium]|nr:response regulator [Bacillota bacterium]